MVVAMPSAPSPDAIALRQREADLVARVRPFCVSRYEVDVGFAHLEQWLERLGKDWGRNGQSGLNLDPDYQRTHVWVPDQQSRFIEYLLRGGTASLTLQWNHPNWEPGETIRCDLPYEMQLVDGKQRLQAVRAYLRGEVLAFGLPVSAFAGTRFDARRMNFRLHMAVHSLRTRADLLRFYLDLNEGGVVHSPTELARVRQLLAEASMPA